MTTKDDTTIADLTDRAVALAKQRRALSESELEGAQGGMTLPQDPIPCVLGGGRVEGFAPRKWPVPPATSF